MTSSSPYDSTLQALEVLRQRYQAYDTDRAVSRFNDAVVRGAAAGIAMRGSLHIVSYVLGLVSGKNSRRHRHDSRPATRQDPFKPSGLELFRDTLRWGAFLGSFSGIYVAADEAIALAGGRKKTSAWRALASGAVAGPSILLLGPQSHTSLSLYLFVRGLTLLVRCGNLPTAPAWKRKLLAPTRLEHGDTLLMCLASMQLLYSWIVLPQTLPPSFIRFLNKHGGKDVILYDAFREMVGRTAASLPPGKLQTLQNTPFVDYTGSMPCDIIHPGDSCTTHAIKFLPQGYLRALPVYLPVYIVPAALVHRQRLIQAKTAGQLWTKIFKGVARSSLFLSLYCTLAWRGVCTGWQFRGRAVGSDVALFCWITGLATLVEKKSRRMELALYAASRALESFFLSLIALRFVNPSSVPKRLDVVVFSIATAAICHCYSDHFGQRRDVFRSKYLAVFDFILGNTGFKGATIRHTPSNLDFMMMAAQNPTAIRLVRSMNGLVGFSSDSEITEYNPLTELKGEEVLSGGEEEGEKRLQFGSESVE